MLSRSSRTHSKIDASHMSVVWPAMRERLRFACERERLIHHLIAVALLPAPEPPPAGRRFECLCSLRLALWTLCASVTLPLHTKEQMLNVRDTPEFTLLHQKQLSDNYRWTVSSSSTSISAPSSVCTHVDAMKLWIFWNVLGIKTKLLYSFKTRWLFACQKPTNTVKAYLLVQRIMYKVQRNESTYIRIVNK